MEKIFVKCKDKTSSVWLPEQNKSVVNNVPQQLDKTAKVSKLISLGALVETTAEEYKEFHKSAKASKSDKLKLALTLFNDALSSKDVEACNKHLKAAKTAGFKAADVKKAEEQITKVEETIKLEAEAEARKEKAGTLVEAAIEIEVFVKNKGNFLCLGEKALGKDAEQIITWASANDANIEELEKAIADKKGGNTE